jgi:hypothetical protein
LVQPVGQVNLDVIHQSLILDLGGDMDLLLLDLVGVDLGLEIHVVIIQSLDSEILAVNHLLMVLDFGLKVLHREFVSLILVFESLVFYLDFDLMSLNLVLMVLNLSVKISQLDLVVDHQGVDLDISFILEIVDLNILVHQGSIKAVDSVAESCEGPVSFSNGLLMNDQLTTNILFARIMMFGQVIKLLLLQIEVMLKFINLASLV